MSEIFRDAKKYVIQNFGNLITVDKPIMDSRHERWIVNVKSYYPRIIVDNENNEIIVNMITLDKLCTFYYNLNGVMIKSPTKTECLESLLFSLNLWNERVERIITKASSNELSNVRTVKHFLRPIELIINYIYYHDILTNEDVKDLTRTQRYLDWINLLIDLSIINKTPNGYTYGNLWIGLREKFKTRDVFMDTLISIILSERYSYMREILNVGQLGTVIHTNCCYYKSCIEADKIINLHPKSIWKDYIKYYGTKSYPEIFTTLFELTEANVLNYKKPYFYANEKIYDRIEEINVNKSITLPF